MEKRKAIYQKRRALLQQNLPYIYLVAERLMAVRDRAYGTLTLGALWNIHELKTD